MADPIPTPNTRARLELSFDILDYIFGFLKSDSRCLVKCSIAHPTLSSIAQRHLYYHIIIPTSSDIRTTGHGHRLETSDLTEVLSETPQIVKHVRVLQIASCEHDGRPEKYEEIALILPIFPALECIMFTTEISWLRYKASQTLKAAVEDCLRLPTLKEVHINGLRFPLSMLHNTANLTYFSLSGILDDDIDTHLKPRTVEDIKADYCAFSSTCAKRHITTLRSLKFDYLNNSARMIIKMLEIFSGTLNNLDLTLKSPYMTTYFINTGDIVEDFHLLPRPRIPLINLSFLPHLQRLTIRVVISDLPEHPDGICVSCLPSAVEIIKTASSLNHLTIEICVDDSRDDRVWSAIYFSPLAVLAQSSASFRRIDLYVMSVTHSGMVFKLARYEDLKKLIEEGKLIIHAGEIAPGYSRFV